MSALPEVVMATVDGKPDTIAVGWNAETWDTAGSTALDGGAITDRRRLLLIDPEDDEFAEALAGAYNAGTIDNGSAGFTIAANPDRMAQALRTLAQPVSPEPLRPQVRVRTTGRVRALAPRTRWWARVMIDDDLVEWATGGVQLPWLELTTIEGFEIHPEGWSA